MKSFFLGSRDYVSTLRLQETLFDQKIKRQVAVKRGECSKPLLPDVTLLVEHSRPVYTLGRRDTSEGLPAGNSVDVVRTKRGGGITYHGPGQLTVYPIMNIQELWKRCTSSDRPRSPIEWFSSALEKMMVDTARHYKVPTHPCKTGVWSDAFQDHRPEKLGSIGLQLGNWVSMHGAGFNVDPALTHFDRIVMCELPGESATSLAKEYRRRGITDPVPSTREVSDCAIRALIAALSQGSGTYTVDPIVDLSQDLEWTRTVLLTSSYAASAWNLDNCARLHSAITATGSPPTVRPLSL